MRLHDIKIGTRLGWGFGSLTLLLLILASIAWWQITVINGHMDAAQAESVKLLRAKQVGTALDSLYLEMWGLVTSGDEASKGRHNSAVAASRETYKKAIADLKAVSTSREEQEALASLDLTLAGARDLNLRVAALALKSKVLDTAALTLFASEGARLMDEKIDPAIEAIVTTREKRIEEVDAAAEASVRIARWTMGLGSTVALGLAGLLSVLITRSITVPLRDCIQFSGLLGRGDFSKEIHLGIRQRGDELGELAQAFHAMSGSMRNLLAEMSAGVETMASAATELSATTEQMAATTSQIARTTDSQRDGSEQMAAAIAELSASIDEVNRSAQLSLKLMESTLEATQRGDAAGGASQAAMEDISSTTEQIATAISVITDIARQTNLLSLNAAIEAAKAGAQGKGFAVVAEEVRKLAERSGTSAKDVAGHIESSRNAVDQGTSTVATTVQLLKQVRASLEQFAAQTRQVGVATMEQSRAGAEVARRVEQNVLEATATASATAQMSATTNEIARTITDLAQVAERLQGLARQFKFA